MSIQPDNGQNTNQNEQQNVQNTKQNDKEYNFSQLRQQLEREKQERLVAQQEQLALKQELEKVQKIAQEHFSKKEEEDDDDEPYVDSKRLEKKLSKFEQRLDEKIDQKASVKAQKIFEDFQREQWLKNNPDFYEVMQNAQKIQDSDPEYAETILKMPDNFERQKLVYKAIKASNLHKPPENKQNIQQKVDQNRRNPYYQPGAIPSAPYQNQADFSPTGQKSAYDKMKEWQSRVRIG